MRFLVDMGLGLGVARWLRDQGHDAVHAREIGKQIAADDELFAIAAAEQRVVVTADLGFGALAHRAARSGTSVILFRIAHPDFRSVLAKLEPLLEQRGGEIERGAIAVIEDNRYRIRPLTLDEPS